MVENRNNITLRNTLVLMFLGCLLFVLGTASVAHSEPLRVSGDVMGVWGSNDDGIDTILVEGTITVPADATLRIDTNVRVLFLGNYRFIVEGSLSAVNGVQVGQIIEFSGYEGARWLGIWFRPGNRGHSLLTGCVISDAWTGLDINGTSPSIYDNIINAHSVGIKCALTRSNIQGNVITVGEPSSDSDLTGIDLTNEANALIEFNSIRVSSNSNGVLKGIRVLESHPTIQDNFINVETNYEAFGIYVVDVIKLDLTRNVVRTISSNQMSGAFFSQSTGVLLLNNTFHLMGSAVNSWGLKIAHGSRILIINNLLMGNSSSTGIELDDGSTVVISSGYNDVWNHDEAFVGDWQGSRTDINENPLVFNATAGADTTADYILLEDSPCIDTGSPQYQDLDKTRSDMGAVPFFHNPDSVPNPIDIIDNSIPAIFRLVEVYPNPFNSSTQIRFTVGNQNEVAIDVFDHMGRSVEQLWNGLLDKGVYSFTWTPYNLSSGSYIVRMKNGNENITAKMNYLR